MNQLILFYFGDIGIYNEYSPAYVYDLPLVPQILYLIATHEPYSLTTESLQHLLHAPSIEKEMLHLISINAVNKKDNHFKLNFPVFLESDFSILDEHLTGLAKKLGQRILSLKETLQSQVSSLSSYPHFSSKRLLYHIICDMIFDGTAMEFFGEQDVFCISKHQPDHRDYLIIGYEDSPFIEDHSNKLLCSSNNFYTNHYVFNSFGDSAGFRKDVYRFLSLIQKNLKFATPFDLVNQSYIDLIQEQNEQMLTLCGDLILKVSTSHVTYDALSEKEKILANWLIDLDYLKLSNHRLICCIPVFNGTDQLIVQKISTLILSTIIEDVKNFFTTFEEDATSLSCIKHEVDIKEIANELWHQIFGFTNEYLVEIGFVEQPPHIEGEGRYLKSFRIKQKDIQA